MRLNVKLFADGADLAAIATLARDPRIRGFTTNPTLMRKAGITDYKSFAAEALALIGDRPISFEVFADDFPEMRRQALQIAGWGRAVYVKIPITSSDGTSAIPLIGDLARNGVHVNVTAVFTLEQVAAAAQALAGGVAGVVSVFAGRIADTGRDPVPHMTAARALCRRAGGGIQLLWASPREVLNVVQADQCGCDIITATPDILAKLSLLGMDLDQLSRETVQMFKRDAESAGYSL